MLHAKLQDHHTSGSEEDFKKFYHNYMGKAAISF